MRGFVSKSEEFDVFDAFRYFEPVETAQDMSDITGFRSVNNSGRLVQGRYMIVFHATCDDGTSYCCRVHFSITRGAL